MSDNACLRRAIPRIPRLKELEALKELAQTAAARIYIGFDKHPGKADD